MSINLQKYEGTNVLTAASNPVNFGDGQTLSILSGGSFVAEAGSTINLTNGNVTLPTQLNSYVILSVKNINILTSGSPADIATISVPSGIARYLVLTDSLAGASIGHYIVMESGNGPMNAARFGAYTASEGGGKEVFSPSQSAGPVSFSSVGFMGTGATKGALTESVIYIRQTVNSSNAGVVSFYVTIFPLP